MKKKYRKIIIKKAVVLTIGVIFTINFFSLAVLSLNNRYVNDDNCIQNVVDKPETIKDNPFPLKNRISWHSNWAEWSFRKNITINHSKIDDDLTNFPVLISLPSDSDLADDSKCQNDGDDIVFTDSMGNKFNHEIEFFNGSTGEIVAWINVTSLSSTSNTTICMYYGNPMASNQQNVSGTWNNNYRMIQHLNEKTGLHYDSTSYGNNGTYYGSSQDAVGIIDGADNLVRIDNNNGDYVDCGNDTSFDITDHITVSAWIKPSVQNGWNHILTKGKGTWDVDADRVFQLSIEDDGNILFTLNSNRSNGEATSSIQVPTGEWSYVVGTYDQNQVKVYVNGVESGNSIYTQPIETNSVHLRIGARVFGSENFGEPGFPFNGVIDEARISNLAWDTEWISTEYNNQINPSTFYQISNEETIFDNITKVSVFPPTKIVTVNNTFIVSIYCNPTEPIEGFEFDLAYNSTLIKANNITEGNIFKEMNTFFNDGTIDNSVGYIDNIYGLIIDEGNVNDPGYLANISFTAQNTTGISELFLNDVGITNESAYIDIFVVNGSVSVQPYVDLIPPEISDVSVLMSDPLDTEIGWENISCIVTDNFDVDLVFLNLTYPDLHTESLPMVKSGDTYYYNTSLSDVGSYSYHIWAEDVNGNSNTSVTDSFEMPPNWDINIDHDCSIVDLIQVANHFDETGVSGWIREDVNNDGDISVIDLVFLVNHFDETW